jgi:DNA-binding cell septation regulator SpoVG
MFGSAKEVKQEEAKRSYEIKVEAARATKNESIVMVDLEVNGIKIKSCMLKEATVKEDGEKHKKGDKCYFLNFPSEKVGDKYYNRVWFPVSNKNMEDIVSQVKALL